MTWSALHTEVSRSCPDNRVRTGWTTVKYRTMGADPDNRRAVSVLALGAVLFGSLTDERTPSAVLDRHVEAGGTFVDTSDDYAFWVDGGQGGHGEDLLGRWRATWVPTPLRRTDRPSSTRDWMAWRTVGRDRPRRTDGSTSSPSRSPGESTPPATAASHCWTSWWWSGPGLVRSRANRTAASPEAARSHGVLSLPARTVGLCMYIRTCVQ
ncbi:hypothetical protein GCM10010254_60290 [Streptomyces chromofuscus]|nr:hypothetical protein GCM10010254_60290 [Streptomyces chromofuscus]